MINKCFFEVPNMAFLKSLYLCHVNHKKWMLITPWINTCKFLKRISYFFQPNIGLMEVQDFRKIKKLKKCKKKSCTMGNLSQKTRIWNYHSTSEKPTWQITYGDFNIWKKIILFHVFSKIMVKTTLVQWWKNTSKVTLCTWLVFSINNVLIIKKCILKRIWESP